MQDKALLRTPSSSQFIRRAFAPLLCLLLILGLGVWSEASASTRARRGHAASGRSAKNRRSRAASKRVARRRASHEREEREEFAEEMEDPEGRTSWFMFQRSYPFESVPEDARREAWEERPGRGKRTEAEAVQWTPIGPGPTIAYYSNFGDNSGRINAIAVSPADPNIVLIGASTGGVWRSTDGGAHFTPVTDGQVDLAVGSIAFSRSNPSIVYAGMGDMQGCCTYLGSGVLKSTDGGQTWAHVNNASLPEPAAIGTIQVDPNDPNRVYAALYRSLDNTAANSFPPGGVFISTDGGVSWKRTLAGYPRDVVISPANPQTIFAAMRGTTSFSAGSGVYRSLDGGQTWNYVYVLPYSATRDVRVAVSPAAPQRVYVYMGNGGTDVRVEMSDSNGDSNSWTNRGANTVLDAGQFGYN
ncbi:MAG TPA: hypothetical protein VF507_05985, partial [Pyrinomonadaceae bacterium]